MSVEQPHNTRHLIWISDAPLFDSLHATRCLNITRELRKKGWKVTLISAGESTGVTNIRGIDVYTINSPDIYFLRQVFYHLQILKLIFNKLADIDVVMFNEMATAWILLVQPVKKLLMRRKPLIVLDTRTLPMQREDKITKKDCIRNEFYRFMNSMGNRWADGRTAITKRMAEALKVPSEKLYGVWTSGVEREIFSKAMGMRKWPGMDEPVHLMYIGCMHYERNLMTFCKAVVEANRSGMNYRLSITGDGSEKDDLVEFAKGIDFINVSPPIPQNQVPDLLSKAHVGVLPFPDELKFQVSSPIKLFEYMASGLPILATRISCHTDVIEDGEFVIWADGSDQKSLVSALIQLWDVRDRLSSMGKNSSLAANEWTWAGSAAKLELALENGLSRIS